MRQTIEGLKDQNNVQFEELECSFKREVDSIKLLYAKMSTLECYRKELGREVISLTKKTRSFESKMNVMEFSKEISFNRKSNVHRKKDIVLEASYIFESKEVESVEGKFESEQKEFKTKRKSKKERNNRTTQSLNLKQDTESSSDGKSFDLSLSRKRSSM